MTRSSFPSNTLQEPPLMSIFLAQTSKHFHPLPITQSKTASMCLGILWQHSTLGIKICVSLVDCHNKFYRQSGFKKQIFFSFIFISWSKKQNLFYNSSEGWIYKIRLPAKSSSNESTHSGFYQDGYLFLVSLHGREKESKLPLTSYEGTDPIIGVSSS